MSWGMPSDKVCEKLKKKDKQVIIYTGKYIICTCKTMPTIDGWMKKQTKNNFNFY